MLLGGIMAKRWPSEDILKRMDKKLVWAESAATLPPEASAIDRFKIDLCKKLLIHMKVKDLSQRQFAKILGINESRVSEIIHYKVKRVTADRLMSYLEKVDEEVVFKVA
jgi:predicted XRE-type DNA-binding protein